MSYPSLCGQFCPFKQKRACCAWKQHALFISVSVQRMPQSSIGTDDSGAVAPAPLGRGPHCYRRRFSASADSRRKQGQPSGPAPETPACRSYPKARRGRCAGGELYIRITSISTIPKSSFNSVHRSDRWVQPASGRHKLLQRSAVLTCHLFYRASGTAGPVRPDMYRNLQWKGP